MATPIGQMPYRMKGHSTCLEHKGRQLELYCEHCNKLACLQCLSSTHKGHFLCELSNISSQKKQDILNFIHRTEQKDLVQLKKSINATDNLLDENTRHFKDLSSKLKMQTDKLKHDLDILTQQTLSMYHEMENDNAKLIRTYKEDLVMYGKQLKQQVQECKTVLQRGSNIEIYDVGCEICSKTNLPAKPVLATACFTPNKISQRHLELALGTMTNSSRIQFSSEKDKSVRTADSQKPLSLSQHITMKGNWAMTMSEQVPQTKVLENWEPSSYIVSICPTIDGHAWTCYSGTITLLGRKGNIVKEVEADTHINDLALSPPTHTLWICGENNKIMELVNGQIKHRFTTKDIPTCICVTASNHVIVGMAKNITKFTTQGQLVLSTSTQGTKKPFLCTPRSIAECPVTHNVAVIYHNYKKDGGNSFREVVVRDAGFKKLFVYRGDIPSTYQRSPDQRVQPFNPFGVVYDSVGNIIVADNNKHRILLISGRGEFLRIIYSDTDCTEGCIVVGIDREDVLWAVFKDVVVKLLQYSKH